MNDLTILLERQKAERDAELREHFLSVLALDGALPITCADIDFAGSLSRIQLYTLAIAASARYRAPKEPTHD